MDDFTSLAHVQAFRLLEVLDLVEKVERLDARAEYVAGVGRELVELARRVGLELRHRRAAGEDVAELAELLGRLADVEARRAELARDVEEDLRRRGRQRGAARALS